MAGALVRTDRLRVSQAGEHGRRIAAIAVGLILIGAALGWLQVRRYEAQALLLADTGQSTASCSPISERIGEQQGTR